MANQTNTVWEVQAHSCNFLDGMLVRTPPFPQNKDADFLMGTASIFHRKFLYAVIRFTMPSFLRRF